ncbi:MAG TPA: FG-GAP-like repeat-containing protein [Vitreimonas sp.]|uniref:FG-GAP-like repeat-containing protein n=1 Tax=Vitreimonas sp. TaxID=3069702 RepID=UPI002D45B38F|nr:FG-GAP-like repeat-containing protein [Vitreimonas sp.]HYD88886.1 FG-GAP-like repeat-containing protein [Vitreimonas sp.]
MATITHFGGANSGDPLGAGVMASSVGQPGYSSTQFQSYYAAFDERWFFTGTGFGSYSGNLPNSGTITGISFVAGGVNIVNITGLSISVAAFRNAAGKDAYTFYSILFQGNDTFNGSALNDGLDGYGGDDIIEGGAGNDTINGGDGANTLNGGDGDDSIASRGQDIIDGGAGFDRLSVYFADPGAYDISNWGSASPVTLANGTTFQNMETFSILLGTGAQTVNFVGALNIRLEVHGTTADTVVLDLSSTNTAVFMSTHQVNAGGYQLKVYGPRLQITAGSANDTLVGNGGYTLSGGGGNDDLTGFDGGNTLYGGAGDDSFESWPAVITAAGGDIIDGGEGTDHLQFLSMFERGLNGVNFSTAAMATEAGVTFGTVTVRNVETLGTLRLTHGDDTFSMSASAIGGGGVQVYGGDGFDIAIIDFSSLTTNVVSRPVSTDFEKIILTTGSGNDTLYGLGGDDQLFGGGGNDGFYGYAGADQFDGGDGSDTVFYAGPITVDLENPGANAGEAVGDTYVSIENVTSGEGGVTLRGNTQNNILTSGLLGDDHLEGRAGDDRLDGGYYGNDVLIGGDGNDDLVGQNGNDYLIGGAGADDINGGYGDTDTASYEDAASGVVVDLINSAANTGDAAGDMIVEIEAIVGSQHADTLRGNGYANTLVGADGDDNLEGRESDDIIDGGAGFDTARFDIESSSAGWERNADGTWDVWSALGFDTLTSIEALSFTDRDVYFRAPQRTFSGDSTSDMLFVRDDGFLVSWNVSGMSITAAAGLAVLPAGSTVLDTADFNGDWRDDILLQDADGRVFSWQMNGAAIEAEGDILTLGAEWSYLAAGDFNGDWKDDLIWRHDDGTVVMWQMDGTAIASGGALTALGPEWSLDGVGDFNSDGREDLLWRRDDGLSFIWNMDGMSIAGAAPTSAFAGTEWSLGAVADINGDGFSDLIWQRDDGLIVSWQMENGVLTSAGVLASIDPAEWTLQTVGDYNGDGRDDIAWQNNDTGTVFVWLLNGNAIQSAGALATLGDEWGWI